MRPAEPGPAAFDQQVDQRGRVCGRGHPFEDRHRYPQSLRIDLAGPFHIGNDRPETRVAIECLLNRSTSMTLLTDDDPHIFGQPFRSPTALPVTFDSK